ncbi:MAG: cob(I)yrinic acid a,c-diamide adenosyltransferase [Blautia sp.]|nr:cob(I)yrinic acid a,c-diamide adenosyltransferase [Blautia sp.]
MHGLIHLYHGEGKGKTTAAMGLALRALGQGRRVVIMQFLKNGKSGEISPLRKLGAEVFSGPPETGFTSQMSEAEKKEAADRYEKTLAHVLSLECDVLVLDELCAARSFNMISAESAMHAVLEGPEERETVITGRNPEPWMLEAADYITEMRCERHPFQKGIKARKGIEY